MCKPAIRFIVETVSSEFDRYGNRAHYSTVTSTVTGKGLRFHTDGPTNAAHLIRRALGGWGSVHHNECTISRSEWKQSARGIERYEGSITNTELLALEQVQP